jgi:alkanesulfonate monooxygenase SsuD/methylene tetrahydromethanopterin reductase-like flavin-dependent oxidoreductase (luciferase family)
MEVGRIGVWTTYRRIGEENAGEAARLAEELGYTTLWLGGSPRLASVRRLLEASERLVVATSIVNIWAYEPAQLAEEYADLARDFADRLLVGYRCRPSRGDERLHPPVRGDDGVPGRP